MKTIAYVGAAFVASVAVEPTVRAEGAIETAAPFVFVVDTSETNQFPGYDLVPVRDQFLAVPQAAKLGPDERPPGFFCSIYYTPKESGFTAARGFDVTPVTKPGLKGRKYASDFLRAVRVEGFGRLVEPVQGKAYIFYDGRRWGFAEVPLDARGRALVPRRSCAVSRKAKALTRNTEVFIDDAKIGAVFESAEWVVVDTGGGLDPFQIDLYWGEDEPLAPGRHVVRPAGTAFEFRWGLVAKEGGDCLLLKGDPADEVGEGSHFLSER